MIVNPALQMSLGAVGTLMSDARDPWWIITSAAVALHGADPGRVADIDVLLSIADAKRILPALGIDTGGASRHADFRSAVFGIWNGAPLPVEFMARFRYRVGNRWVPVQPKTRKSIEVDDVLVFVPDRSELETLLRSFGRPKDLDRARQLAALEGAPSDNAAGASRV